MDWTLFLKQFHDLASPTGIITLLSLTAFVAYILRAKKLSIRLMVLALAFFWFLATPVLNQLLNITINQQYPKTYTFEQVPKADAIIVASWLKPFKKNDTSIFRFGAEKLHIASILQKQQNIPIIVISSGFPVQPLAEDHERTFSEQMLNVFGIDSQDIIITAGSRNTKEAMQSAMAQAHKIKAKKIILIAPRDRLLRKYHTLTKLYSVPEQDIFVFSYAPYSRTYSNIQWSKLTNWIPNQRMFESTNTILREQLAFIVYKILGWN